MKAFWCKDARKVTQVELSQLATSAIVIVLLLLGLVPFHWVNPAKDRFQAPLRNLAGASVTYTTPRGTRSTYVFTTVNYDIRKSNSIKTPYSAQIEGEVLDNAPSTNKYSFSAQLVFQDNKWKVIAVENVALVAGGFYDRLGAIKQYEEAAATVGVVQSLNKGSLEICLQQYLDR
jgi:hypothetical protein